MFLEGLERELLFLEDLERELTFLEGLERELTFMECRNQGKMLLGPWVHDRGHILFSEVYFVSCHWEHALVFSLVRIYLHGLKGCGKSRSERNQIGDLGKCWKSAGSCGRNPYILKVHADRFVDR